MGKNNNPWTLVTGGAGFLGSHLCDYLLAQGRCVICVDNFLTGSPDNIAHLMGRDDFQFIKNDVTQFIYVAEDLDAVLHFASPASPIDYLKLPIQTLKVGSLGTLHALGLAKAKGARFLLASTSECYGDPQEHPQREDYWGNVDPVGPRGVYDEAKRFAEALTMAYHNYHGIDTRIVRIFNTYGTRMRLDDGRALPAFIAKALCHEPLEIFGDGRQTRCFCHVSDMMRGLYQVLERGDCHPINLGNPEEMSILDFARRIIAFTGSRSEVTFKPLPEGDPKQRQPDITMAREKLGWEPRVPLDEGLVLCLPYFQDKVAALKAQAPCESE